MEQFLTEPQLTPADIDGLLADQRLVRLLRSDLRRTVAHRALHARPETDRYVLQVDDQVYLRLDQIADRDLRCEAYRLLQAYQLGNPVNLGPLPEPLRQLVQPELTTVGRVFGAVVLGSVAAVAVGLLAMALVIQALNIWQLTSASVPQEVAGVSLSAAAFVLAGAVGWVLFGAAAWFWLGRRVPSP